MTEEEIQALQQQLVELTTENERLFKLNGELLEETKERKARIAELQTSSDAAQAEVKRLTIEVPLRSMAQSLSTIPDVFVREFGQHYDLQIVDGELALHDKEGKRVVDKSGKAIPFQREALFELLSNPEHPNAEFYRRNLIVSRASGAAQGRQQASQPEKPKHHFGIR